MRATDVEGNSGRNLFERCCWRFEAVVARGPCARRQVRRGDRGSQALTNQISSWQPASSSLTAFKSARRNHVVVDPAHLDADCVVASYREWKRHQKRLQQQAAKEARAAQAPPQPAKAAAAKPEEDPVDPRAYFENRTNAIAALEADGVNPYPHKFPVSTSVPHAVSAFQHLAAGERDSREDTHIAGRILGKRSSGNKLFFYDLTADGASIQIIANRAAASDSAEFDRVNGILRRGDLVGVVGPIGRANKGELSIFASRIILLAPCLRMLPSKHFGLKNQEMRYRQRYLDLILNGRTREVFQVRARIIAFLRRFLDARGFLEVWDCLHPISGCPF